MKNKYFLLSYILLLHGAVVFGQTPIQITAAASVEELVQEEFIKQNDCIEVFNIEVIGTLDAVGSFSNGENAIFTKEGIVFSTGSLNNIGRANRSTGATSALYGLSDAPYITQTVRNPAIYDAVGIEFDFTPTQRIVSFNYVFASEEYCEYVGSEFNDAFGFFH